MTALRSRGSSRQPERGRPLRLVAFGGGTGLSTLLRGLVTLGPAVDVTAVVAVTDDGGSSGILRRLVGVPAVGDARACLSAVASDPAWAALLEHRFRRSRALHGHPAGNLLLAAACEKEGTIGRSIAAVGRLLGARCRIFPATNARASLVATLADGTVVRGESVLARCRGPIVRIRLEPPEVLPAPGVLEAIRGADLIVLGPGSLFTSVIAATLPSGIAAAIRGSGARIVVIQNLTTQRGETDGMDAMAHLRRLEAHLGGARADSLLAHRWSGRRPARAIPIDSEVAAACHARVIFADILRTAQGEARRSSFLHEPRRLAAALLRVAIDAGDLSPRRSFG